MSISFAIIFVAVAAGAFFFLVREDKVRSVVALRFVWIDLGLSLIVFASSFGLSFLADYQVAGIIAGLLTYLFLGAAYISMVFVVHPVRIRLTRTAGVRKPRYDHEAFAAWAQQHDEEKKSA